MVEFALVIPLFLIIVMATVDFGWAFRSYITTTNAAREGARLGVTGVNEADIKARVVERSSGLLEADDVTVTGALGGSGDALTVDTTLNYTYITPLGGLLNVISGGTLPNPLELGATTVMRME
jgi:Flp pilus assembly protein TadG